MTVIVLVKGGKPLIWKNLTQHEVNRSLSNISDIRLDEVELKITVTND